jgi:hypothetical protein
MNVSLGRTLGWIAFVAGALWLLEGLWELSSTGGDGNLFAKIGIPIFAMISATLLIRRKDDPS